MSNAVQAGQIAKPGFVWTPLTRTYWDAAAKGVLLLQRCGDCANLQHYPRSLCTNCWSEDLAWQAASGLGRVWTFTVVGIPGHAAWGSDVPYVLALVELDEGPRLMTNIVGCDPADVACGQRMRLSPHLGATGHQALLQFTPISAH
ncbi:Zn-ribbon domain-containing OB-fold protein [Specibacter sp. RAF43]|uniref:Zn-ribbon domain-containing OB-fold protein n=1 Tax=Specibacter sp. RAF43 TaxID=3233057 RepID=UPI003F97E1E3